jgi:starch-binding outer membrane protein, SusD/RagB family
MKKILIACIGALLFSTSCDDLLDVEPKGTLSESQLSSAENAEGLVVAAYAALGNDWYLTPNSLWPYGNVRADDAYKGGRDAGDIQGFHFLETFTNIRPEIGEFDGMWYQLYTAIRRANDALRIIEKLPEAEYPKKLLRQGELRFLRGHFYFTLKTLYNRVPYIDEKALVEEYDEITNAELTSDELWEKIAKDFESAAATLPATQAQPGRADQIGAQAYLAKTRLYQAYQQNDQHRVTGINQQRLLQVIEAADKVIASNHGLESDFANNFLPGAFENGRESVFAVQYSTGDGIVRDFGFGKANGRVNYGDMLSAPQGLGCCDFQKPSQNLVNAYRTTSAGVPQFDTFNETIVDLGQQTVDPRLDHTVARVGNPWKYDATIIFQNSWSRTPQIYGYYNSLKENVSPNAPGYVNADPFRANTKARIVLRYADVLLFKAEALIELGRHQEALPIINQIRSRAAASTSRLRHGSGAPLANYNVKPYEPGVNIDWNQENARKALRFERRLEMALEGSRFFDLVRWGVADQVMNDYLNIEKIRRAFLQEGQFTAGKHEYLPIPQNQIFWSKNRYVQNPNY